MLQPREMLLQVLFESLRAVGVQDDAAALGALQEAAVADLVRGFWRRLALRAATVSVGALRSARPSTLPQPQYPNVRQEILALPRK